MDEIIDEAKDKLLFRQLTDRILACAVDVHRALGPGLLESAYRSCLVHRLRLEGLSVKEEMPIAVEYRGCSLPLAYRADLVVEDTVLLELKAVEALAPIHDVQVLTYLKLLGLRVGLLLNFNVTHLGKGIRRFVR
jgi:GxxExxY protein